MQNKQLCCIEQCLSNSLRIKNITFHTVPTDKSTYETWCKIIRRNVINFVPKPGMEVCSIHFHRSSFLPDGDLKSNATPMYFPILHDVRCCVQGCSSRQSTNQVFQKFPKNEKLCAKWVEAIKKHNGHPIASNASYVCSLHFASESTSGDSFVPSIFPQKPSYCVSPVVRTGTPTLSRTGTPTMETRPVATSATTKNTDKPPEAKKMRPADEIIILDDDDDDEAPKEAAQSASNGSTQNPTADKTQLTTNVPMRLLQRITQLKNDNAKAKREVNVMKRKYMELKKRCDAMDGTI